MYWILASQNVFKFSPQDVLHANLMHLWRMRWHWISFQTLKMDRHLNFFIKFCNISRQRAKKAFFSVPVRQDYHQFNSHRNRWDFNPISYQRVNNLREKSSNLLSFVLCSELEKFEREFSDNSRRTKSLVFKRCVLRLFKSFTKVSFCSRRNTW